MLTGDAIREERATSRHTSGSIPTQRVAPHSIQPVPGTRGGSSAGNLPPIQGDSK